MTAGGTYEAQINLFNKQLSGCFSCGAPRSTSRGCERPARPPQRGERPALPETRAGNGCDTEGAERLRAGEAHQTRGLSLSSLPAAGEAGAVSARRAPAEGRVLRAQLLLVGFVSREPL